MKLVIDFERLAYKKSRSSFQIYRSFFGDLLREIIGVTPKLPPFVYQRTSENRFSGPASDQELGKTICFDDEQANQILIKHIPRLHAHESLLSTLYYSFAALIVLTGFYIISIARPVFNAGVAFDIVSNLMLIVLSSICFLFALRVSAILVDRHFADTLALMSGIYLLVLLEKETDLSDPEARRDILYRIRLLRRNITLLSLTFSPVNVAWPTLHFKQLENFVRERECWTIAPQAQTLDDLRRDFRQFVEMLVTGQYGNFAWNSSETPPTIIPAEKKPAERVIRFLAGILPFLLLLILFLFPAQISAMGFDHNVVTLFLLAWLLLAIDSGLNLGLIERVVGIAKTFKDLR